MSNFTLFTNDSQSAGSSGDFVADSFNDTSLPSNSNTGFTSTVLTNPMSQYFGNDDAPKFTAKTLFIKDLVLIEDRSKWISNRPTYEIIWHESFPGVYGYIAGNIHIRSYPNGKSVEIKNIDDVFGTTGIFRQIGWILNPISLTATGTADIVVDGVDTTNDVSFGGSSTAADFIGLNKFYSSLHSATKETKNIHDYRLTANETETLSISGIIVYFENATSNIDLIPGSTYVNKSKKSTLSVTAQAVTTPVGRLGAKTVINKDSNSTYVQTTNENTAISATATGSNGAGTIDVQTGRGASFPAGSGIATFSGTSFTVQSVVSVSTDTLTVTPVNPFAISGTIYKTWSGGPTLAVSATLYRLARQFEPANGNIQPFSNGFGDSETGNFYYNEPNGMYRVWGANNTFKRNPENGQWGVGFVGGTGWVQVDGYFSAAEIEVSGSGILHATFGVNGTASWSMNEGSTGIIKKTVFTDAGPGWNSFLYQAGSSHGDVIIKKINLYERQAEVNVTLGVLATYDNLVNQVERTAFNATLTALGTYRRVFADRLAFFGTWGRNADITFAGGIQYAGSDSSSPCKFNYYGKDFAITGTAGATLTVTLDGASINSSFGALKSVATLGFHSVVITPQNSTTTKIGSIDYIRPWSEIENKQNFLPRPELDDSPNIYTQSDTPQKAKNGDLWMQLNRNQSVINSVDPVPDVWAYFMNRWHRIKILESTSDPNLRDLMLAGGGFVSAAVAQVYSFAASWGTKSALPAIRFEGQIGSASGYNKGTLQYCGAVTNAASRVATIYKFDNETWSTSTESSLSARALCAGAQFNALYYASGGNDTAGNDIDVPEKWNTASMTAATTFDSGKAQDNCGMVVLKYQELLYMLWGRSNDAPDAVKDRFRSYNTAETSASVTASGVLVGGFVCGHWRGKIYRAGGSSDLTNGNASASVRSFNGTAWTAETGFPDNRWLQAIWIGKDRISVGAGINSSAARQTNIYSFNATSWSIILSGYPSATSSFAFMNSQ